MGTAAIILVAFVAGAIVFGVGMRLGILTDRENLARMTNLVERLEAQARILALYRSPGGQG